MNDVLEELSLAAHGSMVTLHILGALYNYRRGRRFDGWVAFHIGAAFASAYGARNHYRRLK